MTDNRPHLSKPPRCQSDYAPSEGPSILMPILLATLALIVVVTALGGCKHTPLEGRITDKTHTSGFWALEYNVARKMPQPVYYPGEYRLEVTRLDSSKADCEVTREEFGSVQIGQHYACR